ncbi:MAG TPA: glycosyltransferase family 2 protein [Planctomycetota bacterium]|jgi:glycosyltransferase involved in cell wall biosynthesis|nr:glycosyltransferase family 2 protein [Planctomycetota bacterium]
MVRFSVIIPTCGRPTLARTLWSVIVKGSLACEDEVIVIGDGPQPAARAIAEAWKVTYLDTVPTRGFGGHQRNVGMAAAKGSHLLFMDDDDAYRPGAFPIIRAAAEENTGKILIFRMENHASRRGWASKWDSQVACCGNVSTQMLCIPNVPAQLGKWTGAPTNDWDFLQGTLSRWPGGDAAIAWRQEIIADLY